VLLGVSRKSFLGKLTGAEIPADRLPGALACAALAVRDGVQILRVHDVRETVAAARVAEAVEGQR
jgi:dihydropteroate synthase